MGKSSAIVQLIHSLTTGEPWLGFRVHRTGKVLYLQIDMAKLELGRALRRAEIAGLDVRGGLMIPRLPKGEHRANFNILDDASQDALRMWCDTICPVAVIVDTINDAYVSEERGDINALIRRVHSRFMDAIGDAALIFLNHKRKQIQKFRAGGEEDEDGYLGGSAWAGVVASNLEVSRNPETRELSLVLHDLRLDAYPARRIPLEKDDNGFFRPKLSSQQMLMLWPEFLPANERETMLRACKSQNDVFRDIAMRSGEKFDTVKHQFFRAKGVDFKWTSLLSSLNVKSDNGDK